MNSKFKKNLSLLLIVALLFSLTTVSIAQEQKTLYKEGAFYEWEFSSSMTEEEFDVFWDKMYENAKAAVTPEQIAEAERIMEKTETFFATLTPETLWISYLDENPEILTMPEKDILKARQEVEELFEKVEIYFNEEVLMKEDKFFSDSLNTSSITNSNNLFSTDFLYDGNVYLAYTHHFSVNDGLGVAAIAALLINGRTARTASYNNFPNDYWKKDAYRHYLWNYLAVNDLNIGATSNTRVNRTRIYTTNYELVTNILRRNSRLDFTDNPTALQRATALNLRSFIFNRTYASWHGNFNVYFCDRHDDGYNDLMDLWNNEIGRQDGVAHFAWEHLARFNARWNANQLIKNDTVAEVTVSRRNHIWNNEWYRPIRGVPVIDDGFYFIRSTLPSGRYLHLVGGSTADETRLHLWHGTHANARFIFQHHEDGFYRIAIYSTRWVEVRNASLNNGGVIQIRNNWNSGSNIDAKLWRIVKHGDTFVIINKRSGRVFDVTGGVDDAGILIQQWEFNNTASQHFRLIRD